MKIMMVRETFETLERGGEKGERGREQISSLKKTTKTPVLQFFRDMLTAAQKQQSEHDYIQTSTLCEFVLLPPNPLAKEHKRDQNVMNFSLFPPATRGRDLSVMTCEIDRPGTRKKRRRDLQK